MNHILETLNIKGFDVNILADHDAENPSHINDSTTTLISLEPLPSLVDEHLKVNSTKPITSPPKIFRVSCRI